MTIDLEAIRAAALAATPGPWECKRAERNEYWINTGPEARLHLTKWSGMCSVYGQDDADDDMSNAVVSANAHHIATMDPQTTLALVERVEELEAALERAEDGFGVAYDHPLREETRDILGITEKF